MTNNCSCITLLILNKSSYNAKNKRINKNVNIKDLKANIVDLRDPK